MSVYETEEVGLLVEEAACDRWALDHCANNGSDPQHYDAVATEATDVAGVDPGAIVDAKGCAVTISDGTGSRRGRWWFSRQNHEKLLQEDGLYAFGVYDEETGDLLRVALVDAATIDGKLTWSSAGERHHSEEQAQLRWPEVFSSGLDVDVGGDADA